MLQKRTHRSKNQESSHKEKRGTKGGKNKQDGSSSVSQHLDSNSAEDFSYVSSDYQDSSYHSDISLTNGKLKRNAKGNQKKRMTKKIRDNSANKDNIDSQKENSEVPEEHDSTIIQDEEANDIYMKISTQSQNRKGYVKKNWSDEETKLLKWAVGTYTKQKNISYQVLTMMDWQNISRLVPGRNDNQCHYKWQSEYKSQPQKTPWTYEEDNLLRKLVEERGQKQWQEIANEINKKMGYNKRQGKQCRERWINFLSPDIRRDPWTAKEDLLLLDKQKIIGNQWAQIAKDIPGRTENQVKNRFNSMLKKIREEKTFRSNMKTDIQEALLNITSKNDNKIELEELWLEELIQRKREELIREKTQAEQESQEMIKEHKDKVISASHSNKAQKENKGGQSMITSKQMEKSIQSQSQIRSVEEVKQSKSASLTETSQLQHQFIVKQVQPTPSVVQIQPKPIQIAQQQQQAILPQQMLLTDYIKSYLAQQAPQLLPIIDLLITQTVQEQVQILQLNPTNASQIQGRKSSPTTDHSCQMKDKAVPKRKHFLDKKNSFISMLDTNLFRMQTRRRCRSVQSPSEELDQNDGNKNCAGEDDNIVDMPEVFPKSTKKFIDPISGEVIYYKENGELYFQKSKNDAIIQISDMKQLPSFELQSSPMANSSDYQSKGALSFPMPIVPLYKRQDMQQQQKPVSGGYLLQNIGGINNNSILLHRGNLLSGNTSNGGQIFQIPAKQFEGSYNGGNSLLIGNSNGGGNQSNNVSQQQQHHNNLSSILNSINNNSQQQQQQQFSISLDPTQFMKQGQNGAALLYQPQQSLYLTQGNPMQIQDLGSNMLTLLTTQVPQQSNQPQGLTQQFSGTPLIINQQIANSINNQNGSQQLTSQPGQLFFTTTNNSSSQQLIQSASQLQQSQQQSQGGFKSSQQSLFKTSQEQHSSAFKRQPSNSNLLRQQQ